MDRRQFLQSSSAAGASLLGLSACSQRHVEPIKFLDRSRIEADLRKKLAAKGLTYGTPVHLMAFKESKELEIWLEEDGGHKFRHFATLPICAFSGDLGPKLREGDRQTPEGFYNLRHEFLHPSSAYHLAIDIGFPNSLDRSLGRTGSLIELHGACQSIGCYAMGNSGIEEIYLLVEQSFMRGVRRATFAAYPFRPTPERLAAERDHIWFEFWENIAGSYTKFMDLRRPPHFIPLRGRYLFI